MSVAPPSLLLLPAPPTPVSAGVLSAAYRPAIIAAVSTLKGLSTSTQLLVVIPCPTFHTRSAGPRSQIYNEAQKLLAGIYSLICIVCAQQAVEVDSDTPGAVDARVILLDDRGQAHPGGDEGPVNPFFCGPIIDLRTLALTRRQWNLIFSVDGEQGQNLLASYTSLANRISPHIEGHVISITGGVSLVQPTPISNGPASSSTTHYVVAIGGTFDNIHAGHKLLLSVAALLLQPATLNAPKPRRFIVGITGDELLKNKKYAEYLNSWRQRQQDVVDFLLSILLFTRSRLEESIETLEFDEPVTNGKAIHTKLKAADLTIECVEIQDPFGPTITDQSVTALVVSGETRSGGKAVNEKRTEKGWSSLEVYEIDVLDAEERESSASQTEDFASKISSTAIRKRKADRGRNSSL